MERHFQTTRLLFISVLLIAGFIQIPGCGPSESDALNFARIRVIELNAQNAQDPRIVQANNGKWYAEKEEIRNAYSNVHFPNYKEEDEAPYAWVTYEFCVLRSAEFFSESEARAAQLTPVDDEWQTKEEIFVFKDGKWQPTE